MNVRSIYRLSVAITHLLEDIVDGTISDEGQIIELLLDVKKLTELIQQELNTTIKMYTGSTTKILSKKEEEVEEE